MKTDIGSRSFVEMYLITKEDKSLFYKCVLHLNQKAQEKSPLVYPKTKDVQVQTSSVLSNNDEIEIAETQPSEESSQSVPKRLKIEEAGSTKDVENGSAIKVAPKKSIPWTDRKI